MYCMSIYGDVMTLKVTPRLHCACPVSQVNVHSPDSLFSLRFTDHINMKTLFMLLLFCHVASTVKHSLKYFLTATSGVKNIPEFVGLGMVDEVEMVYCDSNIKNPEPKQDWMRDLLKDNPEHMEWYVQRCLIEQQFFRTNLDGLKQRLNQTGGAHILQKINGCEWDDETGEVIGFSQYGYDGEDFLALDLQTMTWTAPRQQAFSTKLIWDADEATLEYEKYFFNHRCPHWLKTYLDYGRSSLQRTDLPSVSLLQKTPSSPVSCHATGFYPDRAMMYWRKDGEEHHEDVDHGEILPNHDGSFQISVDLILSSVAPEDWRRYDCVFHLSDVEDDIVTKLDKAQIRTNWVSPSEFPAAAVTGVVDSFLQTEKNVQRCRGKVCSIKQVFSHTDEPMVGSPFICSDL
ncbi:major histocompatibility complex class I-related gene protein-like [Anarhichas minor]|uniref:major histocompatibility complex class I-related gene protein-like n=1 Tax=Anarhichas minor TaxID=65739 RepID=UPI003F73707B